MMRGCSNLKVGFLRPGYISVPHWRGGLISADARKLAP